MTCGGSLGAAAAVVVVVVVVVALAVLLDAAVLVFVLVPPEVDGDATAVDEFVVVVVGCGLDVVDVEAGVEDDGTVAAAAGAAAVEDVLFAGVALLLLLSVVSALSLSTVACLLSSEAVSGTAGCVGAVVEVDVVASAVDVLDASCEED